ncbi:MAG: homoserine O-succinyltransferase [Pseudomonadota bacterium]
MPIVEANSLPAYHSLRDEGLSFVRPEAAGSERPLLRVGFLNLMPDAALRATDRQFFRLIDAYGSEADIEVLPFTLAAEARGDAAREHVSNWYTDFAAVQTQQIDALVITGANPKHFRLADEAFWAPLIEVLDWAQHAVHSVLCSCLATHAVIEHLFGEVRVRLPEKMWGVFDHEVLDADHPLLAGLNPPVSAPHSHYFDMSAERLGALGVKVLMRSATAGVHMATVHHGTQWVFFQGHPEYDRVSLMKEYQREVMRFAEGERGYPPFPRHYFPAQSHAVLDAYRQSVNAALDAGKPVPRLQERDLLPLLTNNWLTPGRQIFFNWLRGVHAHD